MDLTEALISGYSKAGSMAIAEWVGTDPARFTQLWTLIKEGEAPIPARAAWSMSHCFDLNPEVVQTFIPDMVDYLYVVEDDSVKRNIVRTLSQAPLDAIERDGELYDLCLGWMRSDKTAVAVRVWSMDIAARIAEPYPELREEVRYHIETILPHGSAGFRSRGKKILKRFTKRSSDRS